MVESDIYLVSIYINNLIRYRILFKEYPLIFLNLWISKNVHEFFKKKYFIDF